MHHWNDKEVDWEGINNASEYIGNFIESWGRINVYQVKEKWGMVCVYCEMPSNIWQEFIYRRAYKKAIKKWPHLKEEILSGADWDEFLEGL